MGAWGFGPFDNDDASDWAWELEKASGYRFVQSTLEAVVQGDEYLEAPLCSEAVAAAAVLVAAMGHTVKGMTDEVVTWAKKHPEPPDEVVELARRALSAIASESELRDLWEEGEDFRAWRRSIRDLDSKLAARE